MTLKITGTDGTVGQVLATDGAGNLSFVTVSGAGGGTGPSGPAGAIGATGVAGPAGSVGTAGPAGPAGTGGTVGPSGPSGPTGSQGPIGITGPTGPTGLTGSQGAQGNQGNVGATGVIGPQGNIGATGAKGATGSQGPQGNTGITGPAGPAGPSGPQGPQGNQGNTGAQGNQGNTGVSGPQGPGANQSLNTTNAVTFTGVTVNGAITATGDITAWLTSDQRMKQNIVIIDNALEKLLTLNGVTYYWNDLAVQIDPNKKLNIREAGIIAQQVQLVLPEVVITRDNGYLAVNIEKMIPLLIEAIKKLNDKVVDITQQLNNILTK